MVEKSIFQNKSIIKYTAILQKGIVVFVMLFSISVLSQIYITDSSSLHIESEIILYGEVVTNKAKSKIYISSNYKVYNTQYISNSDIEYSKHITSYSTSQFKILNTKKVIKSSKLKLSYKIKTDKLIDKNYYSKSSISLVKVKVNLIQQKTITPNPNNLYLLEKHNDLIGYAIKPIISSKIIFYSHFYFNNILYANNSIRPPPIS